MGRVLFSGLGLGFGFWDLAEVGSRVNDLWTRVSKIWFGSSLGLVFSHFSINFDQILQKIALLHWVSHEITTGCSGYQNYSLGLVGFAKKASGWVKSQVGFWPNRSLGHECVCVGVCGCTWVWEGVRGCLWVYLRVCGCAQMCMDVYGCVWVCGGVCGCMRVCTGLRRFVWV